VLRWECRLGVEALTDGLAWCEVFGECLAFDVLDRHELVHPAGHPPDSPADDEHGGGNDEHADQERVDEDADGGGETNRSRARFFERYADLRGRS
jgi:hypothetical protein